MSSVIYGKHDDKEVNGVDRRSEIVDPNTGEIGEREKEMFAKLGREQQSKQEQQESIQRCWFVEPG